MNYCFDEQINRYHTDSIKYDISQKAGMPKDLIPLWVADMDFKTCPQIISALTERVQNGIYGYTRAGHHYFDSVKDWFFHRSNWNVQEDWLIETPGIVYAICTAIRCLTKVGESVLIQPPVYHPFSNSILQNNRKMVENPLILKDGTYTIDFEDFENKIVSESVKLFIFCSPHNPVGRVWTKDELTRLGDICVKHHVKVVSDEIHSDFIYQGHQHSMFASLNSRFADISITCTSPSKTFNLAGLQISNLFIPNQDIRESFAAELAHQGFEEPNLLAVTACQAAYQYGQDWLDQLKSYLAGNISYVQHFFKENIPSLTMTEPEGTYLLWVNFSSLNLTEDQLQTLITQKAQLYFSSGLDFGTGGENFQRINIACPRATLEKAMHQLKAAIDNL